MLGKFQGKKAQTAVMMAGLIWFMLDARVMAAAVSITSPANGSNVSGMVTVTLSPSTGTSWSNVYVDGVYQSSTPPNVFYWQTTGTSNGTHKVSATAYSSSGANLGSSTATVTVANGGAVSLTSTSNGATVSGTVTIGLTTSSSTAWANVYINGAYQSSTPPNYFYWRTNAMSDGQYKVSATAFDRNGNNLGSSQATVTVANGGTASSNAVELSSPANGSTVSGTVNIDAAAGSGVSWVNLYVDGNFLSSSPPMNFSWNSGSVGNGNHTISAEAFNSSSNSLGSSSAVVNVQNSSVTPTAHFSTLPPGSSLPSGSACTSAVRRNPNFEPRPANYTANHTVPPSSAITSIQTASNNGGAAAGSFNRVDGNFTGTTDEILQWGACKWGFDEDLVRALAANESWWRQAAAGDVTYNTSLCPSGANYVNGGCDLSYGITQIKSTDYGGTFPYSWKSTALNVDYKLAYQRACFEGKISYLSERSSSYPNGDENNMLWGCVDQWYTGGWWNGSADDYINETKTEMANKPWLQPGF
jgi:autotransporter family porin